MMLSSFMMTLRQFSPPIFYTVEVFNSSGTFNVPAGVSSVSVLIVAGGGGGGSRQAAGGGGGGVIYLPACAVNPGLSIPVTVGAGGVGGTSGGPGANGDNSSFGDFVALGGGFGGGRSSGGVGSGGCGGGSAGTISIAGDGTLGMGRNGGVGNYYIQNSGGGGGGASGPGGDALLITDQAFNVPGVGGEGIYIPELSDYGDSGFFGGGGGGACFTGGADQANPNGGIGGGGSGSLARSGDSSENKNGFAGGANTGGGGGGSYGTADSGGNGGSGVVIVKYPSLGVQNFNVDWLGSAGVCTIDGSGGVISSNHGNTAVISASLIKLLTCLVARQWVDDLDLSNVVTFTLDDSWPPTSASLAVGDELTLEDVFYGIWVPSGNDAAQLLSRVVGEIIITSEMGTITTAENSRNRFIQEMESYASSSGWPSIVVGSAHGAESTSLCSPVDACKMMMECDQDAFLSTVGSTYSHTMTIYGSNARTYNVSNTFEANGYSDDFPAVDMYKSGFWNPRRNRLVSWSSGPERYYSVIMSDDDVDTSFNKLRRLLDHEQSRIL